MLELGGGHDSDNDSNDEEQKNEEMPELMMKKVRSKDMRKKRKHKMMPYVDKLQKAQESIQFIQNYELTNDDMKFLKRCLQKHQVLHKMKNIDM